LENYIITKFKRDVFKQKGEKQIKVLYPKVNIIRYADDFIVTCRNSIMAKRIIEICDEFLNIRNLSLNRKKTKITNVKDGFNFLGFHCKQ